MKVTPPLEWVIYSLKAMWLLLKGEAAFKVEVAQLIVRLIVSLHIFVVIFFIHFSFLLFFILLILHLVYKWDAFVSFEKLVLISPLSS